MVKRFLAIGECMVEMSATGAGTFRLGFAGDTFNTAWHARRLLPPVWQVGFLSAVGDDDMSDRMLAFMETEGIDTTHVARISGHAPGLYLIELAGGERRFSYWRDTSAARQLADDAERVERAVAEAHAIYFSGITLAILPPDGRGRLLSALERARARGATIAFDSNIRPRLWSDQGTMRAAIRAAARVSTVALPTVPDETELFAERDAAAVAARYLGDGAAEVVVRAGAGPALAVWEGGEARIAPECVAQVIDTTGAGDSFNGAYLAARLCRKSPEEAVRLGHRTAARVIGGYGALV